MAKETRTSKKEKKKENNDKKIIIGILIFFVILIVFFVIFFVLPTFSSNKYGHRLDDISSYKITNNDIDQIKDKISGNEGVSKVSYKKEGRILNFIITFDEGYNIDSAKTVGASVLENITDKNKKYYDIQIFLDSSSNGFPTIGYKSKSSNELKWTYAGD